MKENKIVAIGASAGGLESIEKVFYNFDTDANLAFVVIQHLSPDFKSFMPEILQRKSKFQVVVVDKSVEIKAGHIYLTPPKINLRVSNNHLVVEDIDETQIPGKPIDFFLNSLAEAFKERAIAIILSGTGSDGTLGIAEIKRYKGQVYVESPESAKFDGMPRSAIGSGYADFVGSPKEIAYRICGKPLPQSTSFKGPRKEIIDQLGSVKANIFFMIQERYGVDFTMYKLNTVFRRLDKRVQELKLANEESYFDLLREDTSEITKLYHEMLIGVTQFFRDKEAFDLLREQVIPNLIDNTPNGSELRIWTPGCASGEEPYSLAILFAEVIQQKGKDIKFRIFASDLDDYVLNIAADGLYPKEAFEDVNKEFLTKYFEPVFSDQYRIIPSIRKCMVFTRHNILNDPPFVNMDFISCRNLLIYFGEEAQERALGMMLFSLKQNGHLFLGPSEALGRFQSSFKEVSRPWKIFMRLDNNQGNLDLPHRIPEPSHENRTIHLKSMGAYTSGIDRNRKAQSTRAMELLLQSYVPPSILVSENLDIIHSFGNMGKYFKLKPGIANLNVKNMIDDRIASSIGIAVQRAHSIGRKTTYKCFESDSGEELEGNRCLNVTAIPLQEAKYNQTGGPLNYLISLEAEPDKVEDITNTAILNVKDIDHIAMLEAELDTTKENLQGTIEELEATNEELQSTNEELLASNEELQSTNEELHSVNEELYTVNSEYQTKIEELTSLSHDEENLLKSTAIGTIFLDSNLKVRKFTPAVSENFNLLASDIGRPLDHITNKIILEDLAGKIRDVLNKKSSAEYEAQSTNGKYFLVRIYPYVTEFDPADGVVITFIDITKNKLTEQALQKSNEELEEFAYITSHDLKAPLRHIAHHVELLAENHRENMNKDMKECMDTVVHSASKMHSMIEAILKLSKLGKTTLNFESVNLNEIVEDVCEFLQEEIQEVDGKVVFSGLHTIVCESGLLSQVLQNLIQNSLKYHRKGTAPVIEIWSEAKDNWWRIGVKDNGIGIPKGSHHRAFKLFQRLHDDSIEGLGLGLTICKKIVEIHGGNILIDSEPNRGTLITLNLPARSLQNE